MFSTVAVFFRTSYQPCKVPRMGGTTTTTAYKKGQRPAGQTATVYYTLTE